MRNILGSQAATRPTKSFIQHIKKGSISIIIRIRKIGLSNFKNVENGTINLPGLHSELSEDMESEIIGIYGQNGSGKTAVVEALAILKHILSGNPLPQNAADKIHKSAISSELSFEFDLQLHQHEATIYYQAQLTGTQNEDLTINKEKLSYKIKQVHEPRQKETIIDFDADEKGYAFRPIKNLNRLNHKSPENNVDLLVSKKMSQKNRTSFIFSDETREILKNSYDFVEYRDIIFALRQYARQKLFIMDHDYKIQEEDMPAMKPMLVSLEAFETMKNTLAQVNIVISAIIPGLEVDIKNYGPQLSPDGTSGVRIEMVSKRQDLEIPLRYESGGIKKIIYMLGSMIKMYNDPSVCLVVDELDSGIFEYLLGELLEILSQNARGQLIFTSHNLRPLEKLSADSLIFTTTNPKNRYYRLRGGNEKESLRSKYYRCISLGGQKENLYEQTDHFEIARAFRRAGRMNHED